MHDCHLSKGRKKPAVDTFLILLLYTILAIGSANVLYSGALSGATAMPDHVTLTWASDPGTTQSITWRTDGGTTAGQVQYAEAGKAGIWPGEENIRTSGGEGLVTSLGDANIHSVMLTGLKPGTRYVYRVGSADGWSGVHTFTTEDQAGRDFKFLVFGDSQSTSYALWRATLHGAYGAHANAAFFTNMGDLVDQGQDFDQWNAWFNAAEGVIDSIPVMPVIGNHEYYGPGRTRARPFFFTTQFKLPLNGPPELKGQVYSFDYGDAHFIILDSQDSEGEEFVPDMLAKQVAWLAEDLQATQKQWKIVFMHRPPYGNKQNRDNKRSRAAFVPIFERYNVQLVFTAHDHVYARTYPLRGGTPVSAAGEGTVYVASGRSGTKTYADNIEKNWDEFYYAPDDEPIYIAVEIQGESLTVKAVKLSGGLIETWSLHHKAKGN